MCKMKAGTTAPQSVAAIRLAVPGLDTRTYEKKKNGVILLIDRVRL